MNRINYAALGLIVHTSVSDGLTSARHETTATIKAAIQSEQDKANPRSALITGLQRELRRRGKSKAKS